MREVLVGILAVLAEAARTLFPGSDESIQTLTAIISDGKLLPQVFDDRPSKNETKRGSDLIRLGEVDIEHYGFRAIMAVAIPAIWEASNKSPPFVLDSGYECGVVDPLGQYLSLATMQETASCHGGRLYYLVVPKGKSRVCDDTPCDGCSPTCKDNLFSAPDGIASLRDSTYEVSLDGIVAG